MEICGFCVTATNIGLSLSSWASECEGGVDDVDDGRESNLAAPSIAGVPAVNS